MFAKFTLKTKLLALCVLLSGISLAIGLTSYYSLKSVSAEYSWVAKKTSPKLQYAQEMFLDYRKTRVNLTSLGLPGITAVEADNAMKIAMDAMVEYLKDQKNYLDLGFVPGQKEVYDKVDGNWQDFKKSAEAIIALDKVGTAEAKEKMLKILLGELPAKAAAYGDNMDVLTEFHRGIIKSKVAGAESINETANLTVVVMVTGGTLFAMIFGFFFSNMLSRVLNNISTKIASGAEQTSSAGTQLAAASAQLSSGSTEAAASLEETVASLEELSSMVKLNTGNAHQASALSQNSKESAEKGAGEIEKLISAMGDIASGSKKIEEIISVIDDIAFQTNLLALNAAVEAARAGEQGKGFAVVAEAVRTLAQKSADAAKDISSLIKENVEKSVHGAKIAGESGAVLKDILNAVKKVADLNGEIAAGSQEQATGLEQISKAMNQLDQATQGNAASSEEVAASSEQMSNQAHTLSHLVGELQVIVHGDRTAALPAGEEPALKERAPKASAKAAPASKFVTKSVPAARMKISQVSSSASMIPFDDGDEADAGRKVGNVSGF